MLYLGLTSYCEDDNTIPITEDLIVITVPTIQTFFSWNDRAPDTAAEPENTQRSPSTLQNVHKHNDPPAERPQYTVDHIVGEIEWCKMQAILSPGVHRDKLSKTIRSRCVFNYNCNFYGLLERTGKKTSSTKLTLDKWHASSWPWLPFTNAHEQKKVKRWRMLYICNWWALNADITEQYIHVMYQFSAGTQAKNMKAKLKYSTAHGSREIMHTVSSRPASQSIRLSLILIISRLRLAPFQN